MIRNPAMEPVQPTTFHSAEYPKRPAMTPAARGGECLDHRPITVSAIKTGAPNARQAKTHTAINANPPPAAARYGKRQILPMPTAAPTALSRNPRSEDQRWLFTLIVLSSLAPRQRRARSLRGLGNAPVTHGMMANARAGKPVPPSGFGQVTMTSAPASGTRSRVA